MHHYTLIGSRKTPKSAIDFMVSIANRLDSLGWIARSGGANGADSCCDHLKNKEIYLPWNGFNGHYRGNGNVVYSDLKMIKESSFLCGRHHIHWYSTKKESIRHLHRRNIHQVLGANLSNPSRILICWAEPDIERGENHVKGGTGSAVSLAIEQEVTICNLYMKENWDRLNEWVSKLEKNNEQ